MKSKAYDCKLRNNRAKMKNRAVTGESEMKAKERKNW